jgi:glycosyltransferase involved in cell wall biosynthesis
VAQAADLWRDESPLPACSNVSVAIVIPALNEAQNLPHVLPRIPSWVDEIVLVDGGSTDRTVEVAKELRSDLIVIEDLSPGKGVALRRGFEASTSDIIVMIDADGSMDPIEIRRFVGALVGGAQFAKGSRFLHGGGTSDMEWYRRFGNHVLTKLVRLGFGGRYSDLCYGYNAFWRSSLESLDLDADGFEIETLMNIRALRAGLLVTEVPSFESKRIHGSSHLNTMSDGWRVLRTIFAERVTTFDPPAPVIEQQSLELVTMPDAELGAADLRGAKPRSLSG